MLGEGPRRLAGSRSRGRWRERRRSRGRRCGSASRGLRSVVRELPDLAHRHHLLQPRGGRGEVGEDAAPVEQRRPSPGPAAAVSRYSRIVSSGSIEIDQRPLLELASRANPIGPRPKIAEPRSCVGDLADDRPLSPRPRRRARARRRRSSCRPRPCPSRRPAACRAGRRSGAFSQAIRPSFRRAVRCRPRSISPARKETVLVNRITPSRWACSTESIRTGAPIGTIRSRCAEPRLVRGVENGYEGDEREPFEPRAWRDSDRDDRPASDPDPVRRSRGAPDRRGAGAARERGRPRAGSGPARARTRERQLRHP